ncbi:MAG: putative phage protein [Clostridia bacterium]|nr:putative phage protein [Clostridia bacterium]
MPKNETQVFFYQQNTEVLKFDDVNDVIYIQFDHYIKRKENLQRTKEDLPKGQFYLTVREVSQRYELSIMQSKRLIDKFVKLEIIKPINVSNKRGMPSTYAYKSVTNFGTCNVTNNDTNHGSNVTNEPNKINVSEVSNVTNNQECVTNDVTNDVTNVGTYKKELFKKDNLKRVIEKDLLTDSQLVNQDLALIYDYFEKNVGAVVTPIHQEIFKSYIDDGMEAALICEAIKEGVLSNKRTPKYIQGILNNWLNDGIMDMQALEVHRMQYRQDKLNTMEKGANHNGKSGSESTGNTKPVQLTAEERERLLEEDRRLTEWAKANNL